MEALVRPAANDLSSELVRVLRKCRTEVGNAFALAFEAADRWRELACTFSAGRGEYVETHFGVFADYLIEHFDRGDGVFRQLFVGETIKSLYDPALDDEAARGLALDVFAAQRQHLQAILRSRLTPAAWLELDAHLAGMQRTLTAPAARTQRVLLVGDCIFLDIVPFIVAELLEAGIRLLPDYVTSKEPITRRDQLREASARKFDLVFFSPFSYEFSPAYSQLSHWRRAMTSAAAIRDIVETTWSEARDTIDVLSDLFDCPIHVHNSAAIVREQSVAKRILKLRATAGIRAMAKGMMNKLLVQHLESRNAESFRHLFLFDEDRIVREVGEIEAGAYFHKTALQHPAALGRLLAREYVDLVVVNAWLLKKKVVVCDLDNTLWDGAIGEGAVAHFHDRQAILKTLKSKGVVLAIASKNDPANVHWYRGTLCDDDFVCAAVSWDPKVEGMGRIQAALNLKMKDYVFVDDREDERELMRMTYPEILCVDATVASSWRRFALWAELLEEPLEMDRTAMYRQREERKAFIRDDVSSSAERAALFASLGLKLRISRARPEDLKRVAELINRTNQFNLEGSRTSFREVTRWHESADHVILIGQTSDRFGDMGTTCIAVVHCLDKEMRLLPFVLSCRVFGYGIERGMMNHLRAVARERGVERIVGRYVPTPLNGPCKDFLAESGFVETDGLWSWTQDHPVDPDPAWLEVVRS